MEAGQIGRPQARDHHATKVKKMIRGIRRSLGFLWPPRKITFIVALIGCVAVAFAIALYSREIAFYSREIEFELLRWRTKDSLVVVNGIGRSSVFALDEKQTRHLLAVVQNRTQVTLKRRSIIYREAASVFCMDHRSVCLRQIWVHPFFGTTSRDVIDELIGIAEDGVPKLSNTNAGLCHDSPILERVYKC